MRHRKTLFPQGSLSERPLRERSLHEEDLMDFDYNDKTQLALRKLEDFMANTSTRTRRRTTASTRSSPTVGKRLR